MSDLVEKEPLEHLAVALGEVALKRRVLTGQLGGEAASEMVPPSELISTVTRSSSCEDAAS
ncbi:MAG: hypothetical protein R2704_19115 [Microthrixaceae bacterium]